MEWPKLKNIILIILLITNLFLLGVVGLQEWNSSRSRAQARTDALLVLERGGIQMDPEALPRDLTLAVATVNREREGEARLLAPLLGEVSETSPGGGQYVYAGEKGEAQFWSRGDFSVNLVPGAYPASGTLENHAAEVLGRMDFQAVAVSASGNEEKGSVTLLQLWGGIPVRTCQVTAVYENGSLTGISGARIGGAPETAGALELSAVTGLLRFLEQLNEAGETCGEIFSMRAEYQLSTGLSDPSALTPIWYFAADTGEYTLDILTNQLKKL